MEGERVQSDRDSPLSIAKSLTLYSTCIDNLTSLLVMPRTRNRFLRDMMMKLGSGDCR